MNKIACRYAVVQFAPHRETGEFANVGVVLMCPSTGYFGFRLQSSMHKRVTDFFHELPSHVYLRAVGLMDDELQRVSELVALAPMAGRVEFLRRVFDGLVHPRESLIRFGALRAVLADDPAEELSRQYDYYVDRAFAVSEAA